MTDAGMAALLRGLPGGMKVLKINFQGCEQLRAEIPWSFPSSMQTMSLAQGRPEDTVF